MGAQTRAKPHKRSFSRRPYYNSTERSRGVKPRYQAHYDLSSTCMGHTTRQSA